MTRQEAINKLKHLCSPEQMTALRVLVPELAESEDEKTRKHIIELVKQSSNILCKQTQDAMIAYLERQKYEYEVFEPIENTLEYKAGFKAGIESEKQKEQKVDINKLRRDLYQSGYNDGYQHGKEDAKKEQKPLSTEETELNSIAFLEQLGYTCIPSGDEDRYMEGYMNGMNDALKRAEWSEEDEEMRIKIMSLLSSRCSVNEYKEIEDWFKSLRPTTKK